MVLTIIKLRRQVQQLQDDKTALLARIVTLESDLEAQAAGAQSVEQENLRLQDRLDACLEDRRRLWDTVQESLSGERQAYQMHINMAMQAKGAGIPYPDAPHMPDRVVQEGGPAGEQIRVTGSGAVRRRTMQFAKDMTQRISHE